MIRGLGKVTVAAPGTPVALYSGSPLARAKMITVQALKGNAGTVYIGTAGMDKATLAACCSELDPKDSQTFQAHEGDPLNPEELLVDADNAGDGVLVTVAG